MLTELGPTVGGAARALIAEAEDRFRAGGSPFTGPLRDRDGRERVAAGMVPTATDVREMDYFVAGVVGDIPGR